MHRIDAIVKDGRIDNVRLEQAHQLARNVFEPDISEAEQVTVPPRHRNLDLQLWKQRLAIPDANILCAMRADESFSTSEETWPANMMGMFFSFPRERDGLKSYHIFLSAIHPSARGQGLFPILLDATKIHARSAGYNNLTVSTIPALFQRMFSILSKEGSGWQIVEWRDEGDPEKKKVVMKMTID